MAYKTLDRILEQVQLAHAKRRHIELWKAHLTDAFYHVVAASRDSCLLGFHLDSVEYVDLTLNFGGRSSPYLLNLLAVALHWICERLGMSTSHYQGTCPSNCRTRCLDLFCGVCSELGIAVSPTKTCSGRRVKILGILVDCKHARAWLSDKKRARIIMDIDRTLNANAVPTLQIQSTAGSLVFVTRVCPAGRAFLRCMFNAAHQDSGPWAQVLMPLCEELGWWRSRLATWDGWTLPAHELPGQEIWTDAASSAGMGGHLGPKSSCSDTFALRFPARHRSKDIMFLKALALLTALRRWEDRLRDRQAACHMDNTVLALAIRSGSCRHGPTQTLIREIFSLAMAAHITLLPIWVASADNDLADAMSCFDFRYVRSRYPLAPFSTPVDEARSKGPVSQMTPKQHQDQARPSQRSVSQALVGAR